MKFEIDQSGRVEYTKHNTILAISNDIQYSVLVTSRTKRQLQEMFRKQGMPKLFMLRTFSACIILLIKKHVKKIQRLVIDLEYKGKDRILKDMIFEMAQKKNLKMSEIYFENIGKNSKAHYVAYGVFKKKRKADKVISLKELAELALKTKNRRGTYTSRQR